MGVQARQPHRDDAVHELLRSEVEGPCQRGPRPRADRFCHCRGPLAGHRCDRPHDQTGDAG
eukprot:4133608-Alexandrium_andersonii.AAC.1